MSNCGLNPKFLLSQTNIVQYKMGQNTHDNIYYYLYMMESEMYLHILILYFLIFLSLYVFMLKSLFSI